MKRTAFGSSRTVATRNSADSPASRCSWESTFTAVPKSTARASTRASADAAAYQTRTARHVVAAARTETGRSAAQMAARPEPTARAVPPTSTDSRTDQSTALATSGDVPGVAASTAVSTVTRTYPAVKQGDGDRHGPVALAVGDRVGVRAVAGDRVADAVPDPPDRPGGHQRHEQGYDGHGDAVDLDAGAVAHQPARAPRPRGRRAARRGRRRRSGTSRPHRAPGTRSGWTPRPRHHRAPRAPRAVAGAADRPGRR